MLPEAAAATDMSSVAPDWANEMTTMSDDPPWVVASDGTCLSWNGKKLPMVPPEFGIAQARYDERLYTIAPACSPPALQPAVMIRRVSMLYCCTAHARI